MIRLVNRRSIALSLRLSTIDCGRRFAATYAVRSAQDFAALEVFLTHLGQRALPILSSLRWTCATEQCQGGPPAEGFKESYWVDNVSDIRIAAHQLVCTEKEMSGPPRSIFQHLFCAHKDCVSADEMRTFLLSGDVITDWTIPTFVECKQSIPFDTVVEKIAKSRCGEGWNSSTNIVRMVAIPLSDNKFQGSILTFQRNHKMSDSLPNGYEMKELEEDDASFVCKTWWFAQFLSKSDAEYVVRCLIRSFAKYRAAFGIYYTSSDQMASSQTGAQLVSHVLLQYDLALGMAFTARQHRGRQFSRTIMEHLVEWCHKRKIPVFASVAEENIRSVNNVTKLGMREVDFKIKQVLCVPACTRN